MKNIFTTIFGILFAAASGVSQATAPGTKTNMISQIIATISGGLGLISAKDSGNKN